MSEFWVFIAGVSVLLAAPGPTNALLAVSGAERGVFGSLPMLAAELIGYSLAVWCIHLVLQPILGQFPSLSLYFKLGFSAYATYLAVRLWHTSTSKSLNHKPISFGSMFFVTLLNPKAFGFALVLIPFGSPYVAFYYFIYLTLILVTGLGWIFAGAMAFHLGGEGSQSIVARAGAIVMGLFAVFISLSALYGQS